MWMVMVVVMTMLMMMPCVGGDDGDVGVDDDADDVS
jgi:hypothetical protein